MASPAIVTLADYTGTAPKILYKSAPTLKGQFGVGWSATIDFMLPAAEIYAFCGFLGGNPYTITLVGGGTATRYIPLSHPDIPQLICTQIDATPTGQWTPALSGHTYGNDSVVLEQYSASRIKATFTSVPYAVDGSTPFMVIETNGGSESYTLAGQKLTFPSDGTKVQADASLPVPVQVYTVTIYQAPSLDDTVLNPLLGTLNNATFLNQPAKTMRFDSYNSTSTLTANFQQSYTRTLFLAWRPVPWDQLLRPDGVWEAPTKPGGGNIILTSTFDPLTA